LEQLLIVRLLIDPKPGLSSLSINNQESTIKNSSSTTTTYQATAYKARAELCHSPCGDSRLGCPSKAEGERPGAEPYPSTIRRQ
jgi:hypothetical protein